MTRPRAADDFATIRARLQELRRQRDEATPSESSDSLEMPEPLRDLERRSKERREGFPPPWVPTIFVRKLTNLERRRRQTAIHPPSTL